MRPQGRRLRPPSDRELLATLAAQAATAIANVGLTAQLSERLGELAPVADPDRRGAQDAERRRIERDLHDGAQQQVVALITKLRLARNQVDRSEVAGRAAGRDARPTPRELLADLRELAHGIHPPVLTDRGLVAAVEARAGRLPVPVVVARRPEPCASSGSPRTSRPRPTSWSARR